MRWLGRTVVVLASGPSLCPYDVRRALVHQHLTGGRIIAVNESWRRCPVADVLYGADVNWWTNRAPKPEEFAGERWTQDKQWSGKYLPGMHVMESRAGADVSPPGSDHIFTGNNSSFQAMNLAIVWGARRVVFLGLDLSCEDGKANHWHDDYPDPVRNVRTSYAIFRRAFEHAAPKLTALGVEVINATPASALKCFPIMTIREALG